MSGKPSPSSPRRRKVWRCEHCHAELAEVVDGEAWLGPVSVCLRPGRVIVLCPECGRPNPWRVLTSCK